MTWILFLLPVFSFAQESVDKISTSRAWTVAKIENHRSLGSDACVAMTSTSRNKARLEIYAEAAGEGDDFLEYVIIVTSTSKRLRLGGELKFAQKSFPLSRYDDGNTQGTTYVTKWSDRNDIIQSLKRGLNVTAELRDKSGSEKYKFSLRGSTNGISKMLASCQ